MIFWVLQTYAPTPLIELRLQPQYTKIEKLLTISVVSHGKANQVTLQAPVSQIPPRQGPTRRIQERDCRVSQRPLC